MHGQNSAVTRADSLRNAGEFSRAVDLLRDHLANQPSDYNAELMLGETLYWQGDFTSAARHFRNVLRADPQNVAADRQLTEIRAASAPWIGLRLQHDQDNQPIERITFGLDAGLFVNPLWSLGLQASIGRATSGNIQQLRTDGQVEARGYLPSARTDFRIAGGVVTTVSNGGLFDDEQVTTPVGRAETTLRLGKGMHLAGSFEHGVYNATTASLQTTVEFNRPRVSLRVDRNKWLGEAAVHQDVYPDDNRVLTVYAWLLAPIVATSSMMVQAGYGFSYQNSDESRFTAQGEYIPYFTPEQELQHSAAASFVTWHPGGARFQVNGSYAVYGTRGIPAATDNLPGPGVGRPRATATESFHPYSMRAVGSVPAGRIGSLTVEAERTHTSFYTNTRIAAQMLLRFAPRPRL